MYIYNAYTMCNVYHINIIPNLYNLSQECVMLVCLQVYRKFTLAKAQLFRENAGGRKNFTKLLFPT